jgi:hypothetical protein
LKSYRKGWQEGINSKLSDTVCRFSVFVELANAKKRGVDIELKFKEQRGSVTLCRWPMANISQANVSKWKMPLLRVTFWEAKMLAKESNSP